MLGLYEDPHFKNKGVSLHVKYSPDIDYYKFVVEQPKLPEKKSRLFTFGYSIGSYRPPSWEDWCFKHIVDCAKDKIYVYRKHTKCKPINNLLPVKEYYNRIA